MDFLNRIGIDRYMLLLVGTVALGVLAPAAGLAAELLGHVTFWAVALLFFLYGAKLEPAAVKAGLANWRLQGLTLAATYLMFPVVGLAIATLTSPLLGAGARHRPAVSGRAALDGAKLDRLYGHGGRQCARRDLCRLGIEPHRRGSDAASGRRAAAYWRWRYPA